MQNVEMAEDERRKNNLELKTKKRDYTGYDDDEFAPGNQGMKRSVLAKYDEDIEGARDTVRKFVFALSLLIFNQDFRLGSSNLTKTKAVKKAEQEQAAAATVNKSLLTIDYASQ